MATADGRTIGATTTYAKRLNSSRAQDSRETDLPARSSSARHCDIVEAGNTSWRFKNRS
jgi:hypothetical protein